MDEDGVWMHPKGIGRVFGCLGRRLGAPWRSWVGLLGLGAGSEVSKAALEI